MKSESELREKLADLEDSLTYVDDARKEQLDIRESRLNELKSSDRHEIDYIENIQYRTSRNIWIFLIVGLLLSGLFESGVAGAVFGVIGAIMFLLVHGAVQQCEKTVKRVKKDRKRVVKYFYKQNKVLDEENEKILRKIYKTKKKIKARQLSA